MSSRSARKDHKPKTLAEALISLELSDEAFAAQCLPKIHRTLIWKYRTGRKIPRGDTAQNILETLKRLGIDLTLDQLLTIRSRAA